MSAEEDGNDSPMDNSEEQAVEPNEEEGGEPLEHFIGLPEGFFDGFSDNEGFDELMSKLQEYVETKEDQIADFQREIEDYQTTMREFEENLNERDNEIRTSESSQAELHETISRLQTENVATKEKCASLEEEVNLLKQSAETATETLTETNDELESVRRESHDRQMTIEELEEDIRSLKQELESSRCPPDVPGADRDELLRILDRRQTEIQRLTEDWKSLSEKLEATSTSKHKIQTHLDDLTAHEASLKLKEQIFERDKQLLRQQNEWLTKELESKGTLVLSLKKELASVSVDKDTVLSVKDQEIEHLKEMVANQKNLVEDLQCRLNTVNKKLLDQSEERVGVEDQLRRELSSQSRLTSLYQTAAEEGESMATELMNKLNEMQSSLGDVRANRDELAKSLTQLEEEHAKLESTSAEKIQALEEELKNANHLLKVHSEVLPLSNAATESGLSLTQLYTRYVESTDKLRDEQEENARLNNYLTQIMEELEEKTPVLQKLRREHDVLLRTNEELQKRMEAIAEDSETLRIEAEESLKFSRANERENKRLKALTADLSRQVKTLLQECEEARGGLVSTSHMKSFEARDEVSSTSEVISAHLVDFRSITELQEQNQKLLAVVRELGEEREKEEHEEESSRLQEMKTSLDDALREIETLRAGRERQKEMVEAIVKQRDMYRILLAQSTPLPTDNDSQLQVSKDSAGTIPTTPQRTTLQFTSEAYAELKEQFDAYRREKTENDRILQEQMREYRDEASTLRLDNSKLASKLEYANERYQMLDTAHKGVKKEMAALNKKENQLMSLLTKHQTTIDTLNTELFGSKDKLARLEVEQRSLRNERSMLQESERRSREMYEQLVKEKHSQNLLLTNLQTIQNNMERSEFETKQRLSTRIEGLEKENALLKEQNHGNEERRMQMREAYEKQVHELSLRLDEVSRDKRESEESLSSTREELSGLREELESKTTMLTQVNAELQENKDKLLAMEEDAGVAFRSKIRTLERQLADANAKVTRLTEEVNVSREHCEEYRKMSEDSERSLRDLNKTCEEFKQKMSADIERLQERETALISERDSEKELRERETSELKQELLETQEALSQTQDRIESLQSQLETADSALESGKLDVKIAQEEVKKYSSMNAESQELYQRELVQHGKTMEELATVKAEVETRSREVLETKNACEKLQSELDTVTSTFNDKETHLTTELNTLKSRCEQLTQQNELFHSEIERMSARVVTLTQQKEPSAEESLSLRPEDDDSGTSNLLEIVRFVKREKEIANTKREMAESECLQLRHTTQKLEKELKECQSQLKELTETAKLYEESTIEYKEVMAKVQTLNILSDSNTLLREERNNLKTKLKDLEDRVKDSETQLLTSRESQRQLMAQKDSLLAEKAALRNEVERWNKRTSQLIEQYNKIDPEEYKKLLEEKDVREEEITKLSGDIVKIKEEVETEKKKSEEERNDLLAQIQELKQQVETKDTEMTRILDENKVVKDDLTEKIKINTKLRELGRKFRSLFEEKKKEFDDLQSQKTVVDKQLEELKESASRTTAEDVNVSSELKQQAEEAKQELEAVKLKLADKEDKLTKVVKTARSYKAKSEALKQEKEDVSKELEDAKNAQTNLSKEIEELKTTHETHISTMEEDLRKEYTTYTRDLEEKIEKLEEDLKAKKRSRVVQPQVAESTSTTVTLPSAAVRPTVTTTPTASIRPMPLQVTTAPTAHVTPTQVSTSVPSTMEATATQSSNNQLAASATVFVRSTSPLVQSGPNRSQIMPSTSTSSSSGEAADNVTNRSTVKRSREDSSEYPPSKRCNTAPVVQTTLEMEPSTTTTDSDSTTIVHVESSDDVSPDTQQMEQDRHVSEQSPPPSIGEADLPATIPADTTSDEATEPVEETGLTSSQVYEIQDDNEVVNEREDVLVMEDGHQEEEEGDEIVVMATEPLESASTEDSEHTQQQEQQEDETACEEDEEEEHDDQEMEDEDYTPEPVEVDSGEEEMGDEELPEERSPQLIPEESVGLPDDEVTVDLPQSVTMTTTTTVRPSLGPTYRPRLQMGDRANTPAGVIDLVQEDHQVPCTPVLAEDKQLGKNPPPQSVPAETSEVSSQPVIDRTSLMVQQQQEEGSVGGSIDSGGVAANTLLSSDLPTMEERAGQLEDGDIQEEVIDEIIGPDTSSDESDVEEGQLIDSPKQVTGVTQQSLPPAPPISSSDLTHLTQQHQTTTTSITSSGGAGGTPSTTVEVGDTSNVPTGSNVDDAPSTSGSGMVVRDDTASSKPTRVRLRPIVWDQPSNSQASNESKKVPKSTGLKRPSKGHRGRGRGRGRGKQ